MNSTKKLPPLEDVLSLAKEAGDRILDVYNSDFAVQHKDDKSPLTEADMASHRTITAALGALTPDLPILSEEAAGIPYDIRRSWDIYWLVDPLDGTKEFVKRNGEFTVNIALIQSHRPILGVVYAPVMDVAYFASQDAGAFFQEKTAPAARLEVSRHCAEPIRVVGSRSHAGESLKLFLSNLGAHELVSMGSSLKLCLVAAGRADIYPRLGPTSEWDTAAAQCVVEAAGGLVTDTEMNPLRYNTKESLLNPHFFVFGDRQISWDRYLGEKEASV